MADRIVNKRSMRSAVRSTRGMVATSHPLAAFAGIKMLSEGGNAFDAAVCASAVSSVVEPFMTGIGGDVFCLFWSAKEKRLLGFNGSGRSPSGLHAGLLKNLGLDSIPEHGPLSVTVPGTVDAWCRILEGYGTKTLKEVLAPAIQYAREGFPVTDVIACQWKKALSNFDNKELHKVYTKNGRAPLPGEIFENRELAKTYERLSLEGRDYFYKGELAGLISREIKKLGGVLSQEDLSKHESSWINPLSTSYRGYQVYELPPNTQGPVVLEMLNILEGYDLKSLGHNSADYIHLLVEAKKQAYFFRQKYLGGDSGYNGIVDRVISKEYAEEIRKQIRFDKTLNYHINPVRSSDTVYTSVVDKDRNCVSFISSIFDYFGSGIVVPGTGIVLHNRGSLFTNQEGTANCIGPNKRPLHTIIPAMVLKDSKPCLCFGVMGGHMQPQGHVQVLINQIDFNMDVQEAGEADRFFHYNDALALESHIGWDVERNLIDRGHRVVKTVDEFGGYQAIQINWSNNTLSGGSDPRLDGCAIGY